jgi:hypothetical protein
MATDDASSVPEVDLREVAPTDRRRTALVSVTTLIVGVGLLVLVAVLAAAPGRVGAPVRVGSSAAPADRASGSAAVPPRPTAVATTGIELPAVTSPGGGGGGAVVPWLDAPVTTTAVTSTTEAAPTGTPCRAADLSGAIDLQGGAGGNTRYDIVLTNVGSARCLLDGYPTLVGIATDGSRVPVDAGHGTYFGDPGGRGPMEPGDTTEAWVNTFSGCSEAMEQTASGSSWTTIEVGLPDGGVLAVDETDGGSLSAVCGMSVSRFGRSHQQQVPVEPPPAPLAATAALPATVARGTVPTYTVAVTNTTDVAYLLNPCPTYTEHLTTFADPPPADGNPTAFGTVLDYRLNCAGRTVIAPHESITFAMQIDVPSGQYVGAGKFSWELHLPGVVGPFVGAEITVTG